LHNSHELKECGKMSGYAEGTAPHDRHQQVLNTERTGERLGVIEAKLAARQEQANVFEAKVGGRLDVFDEKLDRMGGDISAALRMVSDHIADEGSAASVMHEISLSFKTQAAECEARDELLRQQYDALYKQHTELKSWFIKAIIAAVMGVITVVWEAAKFIFMGVKP